MWNLLEGLNLIRELQPRVREVGYHITLGGGVLNTGQSKKDLDLFLLPLDEKSPRGRNLMLILSEKFGDPETIGAGYGPAPHYREKLKYTYEGKRVDVFVVEV